MLRPERSRGNVERARRRRMHKFLHAANRPADAPQQARALEQKRKELLQRISLRSRRFAGRFAVKERKEKRFFARRALPKAFPLRNVLREPPPPLPEQFAARHKIRQARGSDVRAHERTGRLSHDKRDDFVAVGKRAPAHGAIARDCSDAPLHGFSLRRRSLRGNASAGKIKAQKTRVPAGTAPRGNGEKSQKNAKNSLRPNFFFWRKCRAESGQIGRRDVRRPKPFFKHHTSAESL